MQQTNKQVVLEYIEAFNRGNLDAICRTFATEALVYGVLGWGDLETMRPIWYELIQCFNINLQVESMIAEGDIVAVRYVERGKSVGSFRGGAVTGYGYEVVATEWFEVRNGLIERQWGARDMAAIFKQMGLPLL